MVKPIVVVGSINLDLVFRTATIPRSGETVVGTGFNIFPGGKGANQAVAAARLGHPVYMIGKLGARDDGFSLQLLEALDAAGVQTGRIGRGHGSAGVALVLTTDSGQNSIVVHSGANRQLSADDIRCEQDLIAGAGAVLAQLETSMEMLRALSEVTAANNVPLILDPAPAQPVPPEILRRVSWLTPNETEAEFLSGLRSNGNSDTGYRELAQRFLNMGPANVVLKLGDKGAYLATGFGVFKQIPAHEVKVCDTTAAGDAFNGAFAVALMRGQSCLEAAEFAAAVAAISVTRHGAQPSMPTQAEVDSFLSQLPAPVASRGGAAVQDGMCDDKN